MPKELKSRLEKAHTLENVKRTFPNLVRMILIFVTGLAIDPHTMTIDMNVFELVAVVVQEKWVYIAPVIAVFYGQDFYRKRG